MKNITITFVMIFASLLLCQGLIADELSIDISAELSKAGSIPEVYYEYGSKAGALTDEVPGLVEKLNNYTKTELKAENVKTDKPLISNGKEYFEMYNTISKGFIWSKDINDYVNQSDTERLPVDSLAVELAKDHLKTLGLFPKNGKELVLEHIGSSILSFYNPGTKSVEEYEKLRNVTFTRRLNGCKVVGATRIVVQMGTDGELVKLVNNWPALNAKQIAKSLKAGSGNIEEKSKGYLKNQYRNKNVRNIKVNSAELVMYDDGKGIVEPALLLKGNMTLKDGELNDGDWIVPVLNDPKADYGVPAPAASLEGNGR